MIYVKLFYQIFLIYFMTKIKLYHNFGARIDSYYLNIIIRFTMSLFMYCLYLNIIYI